VSIFQIKHIKLEISMCEELQRILEEESHSGLDDYQKNLYKSNHRKLEKLNKKLLCLECKHDTNGNFCSKCGKVMK